jgi:hypothetical protein
MLELLLIILIILLIGGSLAYNPLLWILVLIVALFLLGPRIRA